MYPVLELAIPQNLAKNQLFPLNQPPQKTSINVKTMGLKRLMMLLLHTWVKLMLQLKQKPKPSMILMLPRKLKSKLLKIVK